MDRKRKITSLIEEFLILIVIAIIEGLSFYFFNVFYFILITLILVLGIWLFFKFERRTMRK